MSDDITVHITEPGMQVVVLNSEVTIALKHRGHTFDGARVALFLGVVDTKTVYRYFESQRFPNATSVKKPVFGRVAEVRTIDRWKQVSYIQLFSALHSTIGRRFTERHALRYVELVSIGQFSFDDAYLKELGNRLTILRMAEAMRRQKTAAAVFNTKPKPYHEVVKPSSSSDDAYESQRSTNALLTSSIASSSSSSYSSSSDSSSDNGGSSSCD